MNRRHRRRCIFTLCVALILVMPLSAAPAASSEQSGTDDRSGSWSWPLSGPRAVIDPFRAPAHAYGPGHRGADLSAAVGAIVRAPADGIVAFRGVVVDRPLVTVDHGGGYVTTFEPIASDLSPGDVVRRGDPVGSIDEGGHAPLGTLHLGLRVAGIYRDPLLLFGPVERAVLLPCCEPP